MASSTSSQKQSDLSGFQRETAALSKKVFDVFINHRGPDVKDSLAFALYDSLDDKGFWTFLDEMELQLGDSIPSAIQDAIRSSTVQIAIFSPRYAESPWCLDELLLMLETGALFIPIFCDVNPIELQDPEKEGSCYAAAFAKHEEKRRFSKEKLDRWKAALVSCSHFSDYEFITSHDKVEELCSKIALAVEREIRKTSKRVGLPVDAAASTSTSLQVKKSCLLPRNSHPVGIDSKVEDIVNLLEIPQVQVIVVVGMGGSGKTFLLQNVYKAVKSKYDLSIWLSVCKSYSLKSLQHDIASHVGLNKEIVDSEITEEDAALLIRDCLKGKRCLTVLDDLWTLSTRNSLIDQLGLPGDKDCKIVVTTRNREVALNSGARIYEMKNLSAEDSWRLFSVYAFPNYAGNRAPQQLEKEGQKIVKQCGNLPLAIKTMAKSLAKASPIGIWQLKQRQLEGIVTPVGELDPFMKILKLSYDSLPPQLKPCFAYLSFFAKDELIEAEYLINLWIAEGLITLGEQDQWSMGWNWFDQLAQLCLLQIYEIHGRKYCRIHDLLHDLAIQISKEHECVFSVEEVFSGTSSATGWCRILLTNKGLHDLAISESRSIYLRTLSLSRNWGMKNIPANLFTTMRGLRVLDLSRTRISTLPASLGKMILLKVLNLRYSAIREVPECVRHLRSLRFLALSDWMDITELPEWISELECLQYLECFGIDRMPKGISKLRSLRTLRTTPLRLSIEEDMRFMRLDDVVNMSELQELQLRLEHEMELKRVEELEILSHLVKMRHLTIWNDGGGLLQFSEKMGAMKHLEYLSLRQFGIPSWICDLENLTELELKNNKSLQRMPKEFGKSGGFPVLRRLKISAFNSLKEFPELEEGAMASLQKFYVYDCPKLKKLEGLERLKRLEEFNSTQLSTILKGGGKYWNKIKTTNPLVVFRNDRHY